MPAYRKLLIEFHWILEYRLFEIRFFLTSVNNLNCSTSKCQSCGVTFLYVEILWQTPPRWLTWSPKRTGPRQTWRGGRTCPPPSPRQGQLWRGSCSHPDQSPSFLHKKLFCLKCNVVTSSPCILTAESLSSEPQDDKATGSPQCTLREKCRREILNRHTVFQLPWEA